MWMSSSQFIGWGEFDYAEIWLDYKFIRKSLCFLPHSLTLHLFSFWLANAATSKSNSTASFPTTRNPKIMFGFPTRDGEFGWQASLELLHPSLGFIGHWCGGVLIHKYWVLSSAHCIHKWVIMVFRDTLFNHINHCLLPVTYSTSRSRLCGRSF